MAIHCRIRKYRKAAQLTQSELARLLGLRTQGVVSEIESGLRPPSTETALACSAIFDVPVEHLFPSRFGQLAGDIRKYAEELHAELSSDAERAAAITHLAALIRRLGNTPPLP